MTDLHHPDAARASVLIVGGGPVGLVLGMDLASRGVDVVLVEERSLDEPMSPRTNHIASRSMELLRRLGIADDIRAAGLPSDYPQDVVYFTRLGKKELTRVPIPAPSRRWAEDARGPDVWWPTAEPPHRVNQKYTDPVLVAHALKTPGLRIVERTHVETVDDRGDAVVVRGRNIDSGEDFEAEAAFVVGCDGAHSKIRNVIGATLVGDPHVQHTETVLFRAPAVLDSIDGPGGWQLHFINPRQSGSLIAMDGRETWLANFGLQRGEQPTDGETRVGKLRTMLGITADVPLDVLEMTDYVGRRLVADRFRKGRLFICGDASHVWIPFAGFGMNAGLADAANLAWVLAAHIKGWGGDGILDAYERERMPVTEQVSHYAMNIALDVNRKRTTVVPYIEEDSPRGLAARRTLGKEMYEIGRMQYCAGGLNYGYYYDVSPVIAYDDASHPPYTMGDFVQCTVPGHRTPHVWLADGRSLYDAIGPDYTIIRADPSVDVSAITAAAARRGVPLEVLDLDTVDPVYDHALVLSRPDRHVAWRGNAPPDDALALIDLVRGAGGTT